jgi:predicted O-methyltransferase YrrM
MRLIVAPEAHKKIAAMASPTSGASFHEKIVSQFGEDVLGGSAIIYESYFRDLFGALKPLRVLEIGTRFGLSSSLFAELAEQVVTIDIERCPPEYKKMARKVWDFCGTGDRVCSFYAKGERLDDANASKRAFIAEQDFDFCFVDGHHSLEAISFDFSCVKRCGSVLFHDYKPDTPAYADCTNRRMQDVVDFVDALSPKPYLIGPKCSQMALWIGRTHPIWKDPGGARYLAGLPRTATPAIQANLRLMAKISLLKARAAMQYASSRKKKWLRSISKRLRRGG